MREISWLKSIALGLCSAVLLWLGFPGGGELWPVLFVALVPLLFLTRIKKPGRRFFTGVSAGFFHYALQLYWIIIVLGRYGGLPWFFSVPAYLLLVLYMASYTGLFLLIAGRVLKTWPLSFSVWFIPVCWVGLDWLRSFLFSGFPWMDMGYALWEMPMLIQTADLFGHFSITFLILLVNSLIFYCLQREKGAVKLAHGGTVLLLICGVLMYGKYRMAHIAEELKNKNTAVVGVVQGNIDQSRKWSPKEQQRTVDVYLKNSKRLLDRDIPPELIVWPETALPFFPTRSPYFGSLLLFALDNEISLLTGSPWFEVRNPEKREVDFFNSAFIITPDGEKGESYHKSHLVPFGEYVPLKRFLFFLAPLVENVGDFSPGIVEKPLPAGEINAGILICFESIFPEITRKWVTAGANLLVNLTNDAWYGRSSAPWQSMAMSVFRAVESRRCLVRAANTGVSGFVEPTGRVQRSSDIFIVWTDTMEVALMDTVTVNSRYGYLFAPLCGVLLAVIWIIPRRKLRIR